MILPIKKLTEGVKEIGKGNFDVRIEPKEKDEIATLASSFNNTTKTLRDLMRSLKKSEEGLKRAQRIAHLGSWEWDIENNRLSWSDEI